MGVVGEGGGRAGGRVTQLVDALRHKTEVSCSIPGRVLGYFHMPTFSSPGIHSTSDRNGYRAISFRVKRSRRLELTTAVQVVQNVKVSMEAKHSNTSLESSWLVMGKLYLLPVIPQAALI